MSNSLRPHGLQHARPPCPSPTPGVYSNSCSLSRWCHPAISSSVVPFSSCPQSLPPSGSFGQSIGVSALASVLPMNTQDWSPLEWTGWISLQSKGLSRVLANSRFANQLPVLSPHLLGVVLRGHWVVDAVDGEDNRRQGLGIVTQMN